MNLYPLKKQDGSTKPSKLDIWTNRKLNLKNIDRIKNHGWKYMGNKFLDLDVLGDKHTLEPLDKMPCLVHIVQLHDELPERLFEYRNTFKTNHQHDDYNI